VPRARIRTTRSTWLAVASSKPGAHTTRSAAIASRTSPRDVLGNRAPLRFVPRGVIRPPLSPSANAAGAVVVSFPMQYPSAVRTVVFATLLMAGCSGDDPAGASSGDGGPVAGSSSIQPLVDALCSAARTCCARASFPSEPLVDCEPEVIRQIDPLQEAVNGTVIVDTARFAACVAHYRTAATSCTYPPAIGDDCEGMFRGTLREGETCTRSEECIRGADPVACLLPISDGGSGRTGVCHNLRRGSQGDACITSGGDRYHGTTYSTSDPNPPYVYCHSADGLFCSIGTQRTCVPFKTVGSPCVEFLECGPDAYCDTTCTARKPVGAACGRPSECQGIQSCNNGVCAPLEIATNKLCSGDFN
jgi:hypothetical protein